MLPTVILKHMLNTSHLESCFGGLVNFLNSYEFHRFFPDIMVLHLLFFSPCWGSLQGPLCRGGPRAPLRRLACAGSNRSTLRAPAARAGWLGSWLWLWLALALAGFLGFRVDLA